MICEGVISKIPADNRLDKEEAKRLNGKEQRKTIAMQNRILELEAQRIRLVERDSCSLYDDEEIIMGTDYEKFIEEEFPNYE